MGTAASAVRRSKAPQAGREPSDFSTRKSTGQRTKVNDVSGRTKIWDRFTSFKQRGEWVELEFMARTAQLRFAISKPWGETQAYDVGIAHGLNFLRVQVKSTTCHNRAGYLCQFKPNQQKKHDYSLDEIDLFAAYVVPEDVWYLIPAVLLLGKRRRIMAMLCPLVPPVKKASYRYEIYREAWHLLTKSRIELSQSKVPPTPPSHHRKPASRRIRKTSRTKPR